MENLYLFEERSSSNSKLISLLKTILRCFFKRYRPTNDRSNKANTFMIILFLLFTLNIYAANRYSVATGNWNSTSTWSATSGGSSGASVPAAGDNVTIEGGYTVTLNASTASLNSLIVSSGSTFTTSSSRATTATTFTVNGTYNNGSTGAITGTVYINGTYNHTSNADNFPTATWASASNCNITGLTSVNLTTFPLQTYGNVTYNCTGQTGSVDLLDASGTTTIQGNFNVQSTGTGTLYFRLSGQIHFPVILTINGSFNITGGTIDADNNGGTPNTQVQLNIGGNFSQTGGTFSTSTSQPGVNFTITFTGSTSAFTQSGGSFNTGASRFNFVVASGATLTLNTNLSLINGYSLTVNSGGSLSVPTGVTLNTSGGSFSNNGTVSGAGTITNYIQPGTYTNLTISGSGIWTTSGVTVNGILSMEGTATISDTITFGPGSTLQYNTATPRTAGIEWVANFSGSGGITITNTGAITMNSAEVVNTSITINSGATLNTNNFNLTISGNLSNSGTFNPGTATINYNNSTGGQTVAAGTYKNLTLGNTSGEQTADGNITVSTTFTTTAGGTFNLGTNTLTVSTIANNGTIRTQNTGTAITTGKTWGGKVQYDGIGQTISTGTYNNLTLAGSGTKTITTATTTVNGIFSLEGSATVSAKPTYGAAATLQYNTSTNRTAGVEWITPFVATGGITIANTATITIPSSVTINTPLNLTGGKLAIGANTLTLSGNFSGSTNSALQGNGSNSSVTISGSGTIGTLYFDQTTDGTTNQIQNLVINRTSQTVSIGNTLKVSGTVTPTAGTIASNGYLTLISNASGTARIAAINASSNVTGNVTVQRYLPSITRRYRMLSSPDSNFTWSQIKDNMFVTGTGGATNGFDATPTNSASCFTYQESTTGGRGWKAATNINNSVSTANGMLVFVRGDRTIPAPAWYTGPTYATQNAVTVDFTNQPINKGNYTPTLSYTNTGVAANDGWNFVGNPYPSQIDWSLLTKTNLSSFFYIFNPSTGSYVSANTGVIASGQAFFVQATGASPSITFTEASKTSSTAAYYFKTAPARIQVDMIKDSLNSDVAWLDFNTNSSKSFDMNEDALKFSNSVVNVGFYIDSNTTTQFNSVPMTTVADTFVLSTNAAAGTYMLKFSDITSALTSTKNIYLLDLYTSNLINLRTTPTYTFTITSSTSSSGNRFQIIINDPSMLPVTWLSFNGEIKNSKDVVLNWKTANEKNNSRFIIERSEDNTVFNEIGLVNSNGYSSSTTAYSFTDNNIFANTINTVYYRLKQYDVDGKFDYSQTISMNNKLGSDLPTLNVYPNPVKDFVNVQLTSIGNVTIELVDITGKIISTTNASNTKESVAISTQNLQNGVYFLRVISQQNNTTVARFIKE